MMVKKYAIFGENGVERTAKEFEKKFLGQIPINADVGKYGIWVFLLLKRIQITK